MVAIGKLNPLVVKGSFAFVDSSSFFENRESNLFSPWLELSSPNLKALFDAANQKSGG